MCGIAGIFAYRSAAPSVSRQELEAITEHMIRRGPDAGGTWFSSDDRVGLGSRRLAIIDTTDEGVQPMWDVERELAIVFNGEIYNHAELRASLERRGARFHSKTDTEVLLQLYRRDGASMVELLRGMFAFAIWDTRERRLFVARDPYGIKPLYFSDDGSTFRFASQVKSLMAGGGVSRAIDPAGAAGFFLLGSVPEPFTIRRDISPAAPGKTFFVDPERGRCDEIEYASLNATFAAAQRRRHYATLTEPQILVRERVTESVAYHLVADVRVAVFLSAGIDSTALATLAAAHTREPLRTLTLAFEEFSGSSQDESAEAERYARELRSVHTTRRVTRDEFLADLPAFFDAMDQPTIDGINTWFVSKAAHEAGIKVALSGLGGDEMFGGYPSFRNIRRMVGAARVPGLPMILAGLRSHPKTKHLARYGRTFGGAYVLQRGLFMPEELPHVLGPGEAVAGLESLDIVNRLNRQVDPDPGNDYSRVATLEASTYMRNQLLRDADWASMAHSVEVRTPLVDFALLRQLAPLLVESAGRGKALLGSVLPRWLRERPKSGFFVPMLAWMDLPEDGTTTRMRSWARFVFERGAL